MSTQWNDRQRNLVKHNLDRSDQELSVLVSAFGPARTPRAVKDYRRTHGLAKSLGRPTASRGTTNAARAVHRERSITAATEAKAGWPRLRGAEEERDARFAAAVWREALRLGVYDRRAA